MYNDPTRDRPASPAGGGTTLGDFVAAEARREAPGQIALVWCLYCAEPADGPDQLCTPHREGVPESIVDPWLAASYLQGLRRRKAAK